MAQPWIELQGPWNTAASLRPGEGDDASCAPCAPNVTDATPGDDVLDAALLQASDYLFAASGFQWPGVAEVTVRPCAADQGPWAGIYAWAPIPYVLPDGVWPLCGGGCGGCGGAWGSCNCCGPWGFALGRVPIISVEEVLLNGETLTADVDYTLVDNLLVRLDPDNPTAHAYWPNCQNIAAPADEPGTMQVTFTWGVDPPPLGALAARDLACMLVRAECGDQSCQPTARMVQRQAGGTTVQLISPDGAARSLLPQTAKLFLDAYGLATSSRGPAKLRSPNRGAGVIGPTPETLWGYGGQRWGFGLGDACLGCS